MRREKIPGKARVVDLVWKVYDPYRWYDTGLGDITISGTSLLVRMRWIFRHFWTSLGRSPARDAPMNTSASVTASSIEPDCDASTYSNSAVFQRSSLCVISDNSQLSYRYDVLLRKRFNNLMIAVPAAPAPMTTIFNLLGFALSIWRR